MDFLTLDSEIFYSVDYSLDKLTTEEYIRDPRFEEILWSIKVNDQKTFWVLPDRFKQFVETEVDWTQTGVIQHHAHFDSGILSFHHNVRPAFIIDTLSMARVIDGAKAGNSLAMLAQRHGFGEKGTFVQWAKGKHLADFSRDELQQYGQYCCNDTDLTYQLAQKFVALLPEHELRLIDMNCRMFTEPVFIGDQEKLRLAAAAERQRKTELLRRIGLLCQRCYGNGKDPELGLIGTPERPCKLCEGSGVNKKPIGSNEQFANLLRAQGVEPETKRSNTTGEQIYAFARTDSHMQSLLEDEDEQVRFLAEARVGIKSNIIESRATRFLHCAQRGPMPVYINHAGAHTLRPSGGDSMNFLNMSNQNEARPEMFVLKQSIQAPPGHKVVAVDSAQGEARILAWFAGQHDLVQAFAEGRDVYSEYASDIYHRVVDRKKVKADYIPGQLGKISILQLGFGAGYYTVAGGLLKGLLGNPPIQLTIEHMQALQVDPSPFLNNPKKVAKVAQMPSRLELNDRLIHCIVAEALVNRYRLKYKCITGGQYGKEQLGFWQVCEQAIDAMIEGREMVFGAHGVFRTAKDRVYGPTGLWLDYRGIERDQNNQASYWNGRERTRIYGALFTENLDQHFHRLIVCEQALAIGQRYKVALLPYDEVACVVPEDRAQEALEFMLKTIAGTPTWAPGLPLASEGGYGGTYATAK